MLLILTHWYSSLPWRPLLTWVAGFSGGFLITSSYLATRKRHPKKPPPLWRSHR